MSTSQNMQTLTFFSTKALVSAIALTAVISGFVGYEASPTTMAVHQAQTYEQKAWNVLKISEDQSMARLLEERAFDTQINTALRTRQELISAREGIQRLKEKEGLPDSDKLIKRISELGYAQGASILELSPHQNFRVSSVSYGKHFSRDTVILHMVNQTGPVSHVYGLSYEDYLNGKGYKKDKASLLSDEDFQTSFDGINDYDIRRLDRKHDYEEVFYISGNDVTLYL